MMEQSNETFSYTYSATQQAEAKRIRQKYAPPEQNKLELLKRLDESADQPGTVAALVVGLLAALVFGVGLCCVLMWEAYFVPGIVIGIVGLLGLGAAYPLYLMLTKQKRKKLAPEILRLSQELIDEK